ncbi:35196_t:CDS:2 [Gigaspora margarita]|uniref:35196_t:CDS:1 n=1 Tax=Gigaspora margarita TaxID=4874 RepID=A0ABN7UHM9_GIGMA|nr:35196_t:CDS:2 [Gigaspora margarita]
MSIHRLNVSPYSLNLHNDLLLACTSLYYSDEIQEIAASSH